MELKKSHFGKQSFTECALRYPPCQSEFAELREPAIHPEGNAEHIEYLMLEEDSPIKVAQYYTKLPDKKLLSEQLQRAIAIAKERYAETLFEKKDNK